MTDERRENMYKKYEVDLKEGTPVISVLQHDNEMAIMYHKNKLLSVILVAQSVGIIIWTMKKRRC